MTTINEAAERNLFEAHIRNECDTEEYATLSLQKTANGFYHTTRIQGAWEGWQARATLPQGAMQAAEPVCWIVFAEHEGMMVPQYPACFTQKDAEYHASMYGQTPTKVHALGVIGAAPDRAPSTDSAVTAAKHD